LRIVAKCHSYCELSAMRVTRSTFNTCWDELPCTVQKIAKSGRCSVHLSDWVLVLGGWWYHTRSSWCLRIHTSRLTNSHVGHHLIDTDHPFMTQAVTIDQVSYIPQGVIPFIVTSDK
jgi:hypothetical protein